MNAGDLLAELRAAGVHVRRVGDNVKVRAEPGVSIAPYLDRIRAHKPALLRELLQEQIKAALDVEPEHFDRRGYEMLYQVWKNENARENAQ